MHGDCQRYNTHDDDNFTQVGTFYRKVLNDEERTRLVENIAGHLKDAATFIQERVVKNFSQADSEYGGRIAELLKKYKSVRTVLCDMPHDPYRDNCLITIPVMLDCQD